MPISRMNQSRPSVCPTDSALSLVMHRISGQVFKCGVPPYETAVGATAGSRELD